MWTAGYDRWNMRSLRFQVIAAAVILAGSGHALARAQHDVHASLIAKATRKPTPAFRLAGETGKSIQISNFRGRVVLINFWATKCGGCILEIPSFIELQQAYQNKGFTAVGISADIPYDDLKNSDEAWKLVRPFITSHHITYPILMGDEKVVDAFHIHAYPATYLVDKTGRIAATYIGVVDKKDVAANIDRLLKE
jgi:peroxiredoxin